MAPTIPIIGLVLALLFGGCGTSATSGPSTGPAPTPDPEIELVAGWSEADVPREVLEAVGTPDRVIHDDAGLEELVEAASPELDVSALRDIDLDEVVLVVGSYPRCGESSLVEVFGGGTGLRFLVVLDDGPVECVWAPLQVDVWSVPRAGLVDEPGLVTL